MDLFNAGGSLVVWDWHARFKIRDSQCKFNDMNDMNDIDLCVCMAEVFFFLLVLGTVRLMDGWDTFVLYDIVLYG